MQKMEICLIVKDSLEALKLYRKIFDVEVVLKTDNERGLNEAFFKICDTQFHMLDENPDYQLIGPKEGQILPIWFNITVRDIYETHNKALNCGCKEFQAVTEFKEYNVTNSSFIDPYGYMWMLHQGEK